MPPLRLKRYLLTGLLTFIPLWVTWTVFKLVLGMLAGIGAPLVNDVRSDPQDLESRFIVRVNERS